MGIMNAPMMLAASSGDDVDFMVHGLIPLKFFGHKVWITTTHVTTLIVMVFIIVLALIARHAVLHGDEKPSGLQNFVEMIVEMLDNLVKGSMGRHWRPFVNYIGTIMVFIFFANTSGLFGLRPPTADYGTTLALALITFVLIQYSAFTEHEYLQIKTLALHYIGTISLYLFSNRSQSCISVDQFVTSAFKTSLHVFTDLFMSPILFVWKYVSSFVWKYYGGYDHDGIVVRIAAMACAARYSSILAYVL